MFISGPYRYFRVVFYLFLIVKKKVKRVVKSRVQQNQESKQVFQ